MAATDFLITFCTYNSWIAIFVLGFMTLIARSIPELLKIEKEYEEAGRDALTYATGFYIILAVVLTLYSKLKP